MNPADMREMFARKVSRYTLAQCVYALADCHATLAIWQPVEPGNPDATRDGMTDYTRKLWAEVDALRDRVREINRPARRIRQPANA